MANENETKEIKKQEVKPQEELKQKTPEQKKENERFAKLLKEIEQAVFSIKFYPVAVKKDAKQQAVAKIKEIYKKENETTKQLILYMLHEALSQSGELKTMHNLEFFKRKFPTAEPGRLRIHVYRAMFNYNYSIEGLIDIIKLLGELGDDDAVKVLTYHFSFLTSIEVESTHMLRNAIIETLGKTNSTYALTSLLEYAKYTDNEKMFQRIANALVKWDQKLETMTLPKKEKERLKKELKKVFTTEFGSSHYG